MNPVREWDWKGALWLLGFVLLAAILVQFFGARLDAYRIPIAVIYHTLVIVFCAWKTVELWRRQEHRSALVGMALIVVWGGLLFLDMRPVLAP